MIPSAVTRVRRRSIAVPIAIAAGVAAALALGFLPGTPDRRQTSADFPSAHVPPRHDRLRPVRPGRPDDRLQRGVGGKAARALRRALGGARSRGRSESWEPRCSASRGPEKSPSRSGATALYPSHRPERSRGRRWPAARRPAKSSKTSSSRIGVPTVAHWRSCVIVGAKTQLEYPIGKTLYETTGWIGNVRVSPKGDRIAFFDYEFRGDNCRHRGGLGRAGKKTTISSLFSSCGGLAWSPDGAEVWFTAAPVGANQALYATSLSGKTRVLSRVTGSLTLHDVSRDGRALVTHDNFRIGIVALLAGEDRQRDLSWLDWGTIRDVSPDGKMLLFEESGEGGGPGYSVYVRNVDGSPAIRLGEGTGQSFLPDGKSVLAIVHPVTDTRS